MNKVIAIIICICFFCTKSFTQACTPLGDETTYGTSDVWIGYVYDNINFTSYAGYVNQGITGNPNFDQSFGGNVVSYATNGCSVQTETFSVRYKLNKTFINGSYDITVGGDDGYRFSIDGGATWVINNWGDHGYATTLYTVNLNGNYNLVLEYYENAINNRVSFNITSACYAAGDQSIYGTGDVWIGYAYDGTALNPSFYKGSVTEGALGNPNFDQSFGGSNTNYNTSVCPVFTETFSMRYRLRKTFANGLYQIVVGGDDGYRFSTDGGATWAINNWSDHAYTSTNVAFTLDGIYDLVLEYYENGGGNRVTFNILSSVLPVNLISFTGTAKPQNNTLNWQVSQEDQLAYYEVQSSKDGNSFTKVVTVLAKGSVTNTVYEAIDPLALSGITYYRLKMVNQNNSFTYSPIIKLNSIVDKNILIFPTIIKDNKVNIKASETLQNASIVLYDLTGRIVSSVALPKKITSGETIAVNLSNQLLAKGNYAFVITSSSSKKITQFIRIE
jgi:hypothetical protein